MQIQERLIVPGLGVVILLSAFILGVPLVYKLLLALLGLAASATYFAPHDVQVETRIAIAALGLVILLIVTSTAFWLVLMSFAAIAALQFQHRHILQRNPATIEWLSAVLKGAQARRSGRTVGEGEAEGEAGEESAAGDGERASAPKPLGVDALPGFVRVNVAGIGGLVAGVLVLVSIFMPWYGFLISANGETAGGLNFTLIAVATENDELPAFQAFFYILLVLGVLSIISMVLPRAVAAIIAALGLAVTFVSYAYMVAQVERDAAELSDLGVGATAIPAVGALIAGACFLAMLVLQLIPGLNRSRDKG